MTTAREVVSAWLKEPSDLPFGCDEVVDEIFATLAAAGYHLCREGEVPPWMEPEPCTLCRGKGKRDPHCWRCSDSTDDHECPPAETCSTCKGSGLSAAYRLTTMPSGSEPTFRCREGEAVIGGEVVRVEHPRSRDGTAPWWLDVNLNSQPRDVIFAVVGRQGDPVLGVDWRRLYRVLPRDVALSAPPAPSEPAGDPEAPESNAQRPWTEEYGKLTATEWFQAPSTATGEER